MWGDDGVEGNNGVSDDRENAENREIPKNQLAHRKTNL